MQSSKESWANIRCIWEAASCIRWVMPCCTWFRFIPSTEEGIFLPFVDEDPKTAEIMSKILLFAEDTKIKDPGILNQIR